MEPQDFKGTNIVFGKNQPEYLPLPAYKKPNDPRGEVVTKWKLSEEEIKMINETGCLYLSVLTFNEKLQPVLLTTDFPE